MIVVEPPARRAMPKWAVWALMTALYRACQRDLESSAAQINLIEAVMDVFIRPGDPPPVA